MEAKPSTALPYNSLIYNAFLMPIEEHSLHCTIHLNSVRYLNEGYSENIHWGINCIALLPENYGTSSIGIP